MPENKRLRLVVGNRFKVTRGRFFIHIDAQDAQDFFLKTAGLRF